MSSPAIRLNLCVPGAVRAFCCAALLTIVLSIGCQAPQRVIIGDNPELSAFVNIMLPRKIEVQRALTKAVAFDEAGNQNGIEVVMAVTDILGDEIKCTGTFNFELHAERPASGDRFGKRWGFWTVKVDDEASLREYWDRWSRFYKFRLQLDERTLPPGRYILSAQYMAPTGDKLFDEYTMQHSGNKTTGN